MSKEITEARTNGHGQALVWIGTFMVCAVHYGGTLEAWHGYALLGFGVMQVLFPWPWRKGAALAAAKRSLREAMVRLQEAARLSLGCGVDEPREAQHLLVLRASIDETLRTLEKNYP
jgi:hypothetical protein